MQSSKLSSPRIKRATVLCRNWSGRRTPYRSGQTNRALFTKTRRMTNFSRSPNPSMSSSRQSYTSPQTIQQQSPYSWNNSSSIATNRTNLPLLAHLSCRDTRSLLHTTSAAIDGSQQHTARAPQQKRSRSLENGNSENRQVRFHRSHFQPRRPSLTHTPHTVNIVAGGTSPLEQTELV